MAKKQTKSIEDLKKELAELDAKAKKDKEIYNLKRKIKIQKFNQSRSGKVFSKIADAGDKLKKMKSNKKPSNITKTVPKRVSIDEIMRKLPQ